MAEFPEAIVEAVLHHMNIDHAEDSLIIVRAFVDANAETATMIGLDSEGGQWRYTAGAEERVASVGWPSGEISERPQIRREVVLLYRAACSALGIEPRAEEAPPAGLHQHGSEDGGEHSHH